MCGQTGELQNRSIMRVQGPDVDWPIGRVLWKVRQHLRTPDVTQPTLGQRGYDPYVTVRGYELLAATIGKVGSVGELQGDAFRRRLDTAPEVVEVFAVPTLSRLRRRVLQRRLFRFFQCDSGVEHRHLQTSIQEAPGRAHAGWPRTDDVTALTHLRYRSTQKAADECAHWENTW